jgi:putative two-component system response regulator
MEQQLDTLSNLQMTTITNAIDDRAIVPPFPSLSSGPVTTSQELEDAGQRVKHCRVMIVDDEPTNIKILRRLLELEGYHDFVTSTDSRPAVEMIRQEQPDIVLLDLMMPYVSGLDILAEVRNDPSVSYIPMIILTAVTDRDTRVQAIELGAMDFLNKPIDSSELVPRIRNVLIAKASHDRLKNYSHDLEHAVRERTTELEISRRDLIHCLARAAEYRDDDTGHHVFRVGQYARLIGEALGLDEKSVDTLEQAAALHDIGKIGVPDAILLKPGKLTEDEFMVMQKHASIGKRIMSRCSPDDEIKLRRHAEVGAKILEVGSSHVLDMARTIALTHHERWDGSGYPLGLKGEDIPLEGRVSAVADVFDALSSRRCYKEAFPIDKCFSIMEEQRGSHFDPKVLDAFFTVRDQIIDVQIRYADES